MSSFSLNVWQNSSVNPLGWGWGGWHFLFCRVIYNNLFKKYRLFRLFLHEWFSVVCVFQVICPFHPSYQICGHRFVPSIPYFIILLMSIELVVIPLFYFWYWWFVSPLFLCLVSIARGLSVFMIFQRTSFGFSLFGWFFSYFQFYLFTF